MNIDILLAKLFYSLVWLVPLGLSYFVWSGHFHWQMSYPVFLVKTLAVLLVFAVGLSFLALLLYFDLLHWFVILTLLGALLRENIIKRRAK